MMTLSIVHCSLFINLSASAQSFTQRIQQDVVAGARITIHQDDAITDLVNGKSVATPATPRQNNNRPRQNSGQGNTQNSGQGNVQSGGQSNAQNSGQGNSQNNGQGSGQNNNQQAGRTDTPETTPTEPVQTTDSVAVAPRRTRKMAGFRVQPFVGGNSRADRVKAERTGAELQTLFPGHRVYVHFLGGKWTCRLGDFRTMAEAKEVLDELVKLGYDRAMMVRGQINVPY